MTKYECVRCANRYEGEVDCPKCGCGVATSVFPDAPAKMCNCNQGRLPCTCKVTPDLRSIAAEILGKLDHPTACVTSLDADKLRTALKVADDTEAELYAAQDQITGLQELMAAQRAPESLDAAVRYLVAHANSQSDNAPSGSPQHGHSVTGRWDGDRTNPKGSLCEECAAWDTLRQYAATDIEAVERVMAPVPQPMDTAPTDGTRVLIHTEVHHYSADRYQICAWRMIGTQWLEARFKDSEWAEWCGNEKTNSNNTLHPIEWAPLPVGEPQ